MEREREREEVESSRRSDHGFDRSDKGFEERVWQGSREGLAKVWTARGLDKFWERSGQGLPKV